eukprot:CAMPEP_0202869126 /NCGR_PEP_ID=MMETSP1391-20130828/11914_1 /ASSEMBLY_ACC=CAM_ASM_000867 /TAXON_ID=1034604 /ORGANISM="Chlamydomonas leiostraca, Strain SAG 11-49" /LENGTH=262 /DNA_ID=CAMNT_0049549391 /DNA_START=57 /DNA_END=845 /DNA_ORIENTATION=+
MQLSRTAIASRPRAPLSAPRTPLVSRPSSVCQAKRREIDRDVAFSDFYEGIADRVNEGRGLPVRDTFQLVECIRTVDQANRFLDLMQRYLEVKAERSALNSLSSLSSLSSVSSMDGEEAPSSSGASPSATYEFGKWLSDWHYRKRYLARLAEIAVLELNKPELLYKIMGNMRQYRISTYFGKDLILSLGRAGVDTEVLQQVAALVLEQRGVGDKGTRGAHFALLEVLRARGAGPEAVATVKSVLNSTKPAAPPAATAQVSFA